MEENVLIESYNKSLNLGRILLINIACIILSLILASACAVPKLIACSGGHAIR